MANSFPSNWNRLSAGDVPQFIFVVDNLQRFPPFWPAGFMEGVEDVEHDCLALSRLGVVEATSVEVLIGKYAVWEDQIDGRRVGDVEFFGDG